MLLTRFFSAWLLLVPLSHAAIVDVFPTSPDALQNAIDAAAPGDILRIHGGTGANVFFFGGGLVGNLPDGLPVISQQHVQQLANLEELQAPTTGGVWRLRARTGPSGGLMRIAFALGPIEFQPPIGWNLIESAQVFIYRPVAPLLEVVEFPVLPSPNLFGFDLTAELYDNAYGIIGGTVITQQR